MKEEYTELVKFCDELLIDEDIMNKKMNDLKKENLKLIQAVEILNQTIKDNTLEEECEECDRCGGELAYCEANGCNCEVCNLSECCCVTCVCCDVKRFHYKEICANCDKCNGIDKGSNDENEKCCECEEKPIAVYIGKQKENSGRETGNYVWFFYNEDMKKWLIEEGINGNTENIYPYGKGFINDEDQFNEIMKNYERMSYKIKKNNTLEEEEQEECEVCNVCVCCANCGKWN